MKINSMERIWKEAELAGFSSSKEKPVSFRNIKSIHFIDKFKSTYRFNLVGLMVTALMVVFAFTLGGVAIEGFILFTVFSLLSILGYQRLNALGSLKKEESTRNYFLAFHAWLSKMLHDFQVIYKFVYPLLFLTFVSAIFRTNLFSLFLGETLWEKVVSNSDTYLVNGLPVVYISIFLGITILISIFSEKLFKIDINSVYGRIKTELDSLLKEFESE